jgi:YesN/AraC family two-component response regulator
MSRTDILLVEDEEVIIGAFKKLLKEERVKIDAVTHAEEAVHRLEKNSYKMVISDLMLPNFSGLDLLKVVSSKMPTTPFVMISGYATLDNAIQSFKLGAFDFIPKPFDVDEILGVVYRALDFSGKGAGSRQEEKVKNPDLHFLGRHSWAKKEADKTVVLGLGETFSTISDKMTELDFQPVNTEVKQGNIFLKIKCGPDRVHNVWAPLSGTVIEINKAFEGNPQAFAKSNLSESWLVRMKPTFYESELSNLS